MQNILFNNIYLTLTEESLNLRSIIIAKILFNLPSFNFDVFRLEIINLNL